jgi:hypothetical protein
MNSYFFNVTEEEKKDILSKHRELYNGYVTQSPTSENKTQLTVQDFAKDKKGITLKNSDLVKENKHSKTWKKSDLNKSNKMDYIESQNDEVFYEIELDDDSQDSALMESLKTIVKEEKLGVIIANKNNKNIVSENKTNKIILNSRNDFNQFMNRINKY